MFECPPAQQRRRRRSRLHTYDRPWPATLTIGDKLQRLALLAPVKLRALELLLDECLADVWPRL